MTPEQAQAILHEYRLRMREAAVAWRRVHADEHSAWTFETVKHLAFVNAAGLAGAAALYAAPDLGKKIVGPCSVPIALLFAIGLVMAVIDMYLNSLGALARLKELDSRLKIWDIQPLPGQIEAAELLKDIERGSIFFRFAGYAGWCSAFLFLAGVYPLAFLRF